MYEKIFAALLAVVAFGTVVWAWIIENFDDKGGK